MAEKSGAQPNFYETIKEWLQSLPTDIKILIEMVGDDQLDMQTRTLAAGTVFYVLAPIDLIPEKIPVLGYVDDVVVLHIALAVIVEIDPERRLYYREKYPRTFRALDQQMELLKDTLGALYAWLRALVESLRKRRHHRQSTEDFVHSEQAQEELFDEAMVYAADINVDAETIERALLGAPPDQIIGLLSRGLEDEQKRQVEQEKGGVVKRLSDASASFRRFLGRGKDSESDEAASPLPTSEG